jgi:hypothetical protein
MRLPCFRRKERPLSFFDEDDQTTRTRTRPRRATPSPDGGGGPVDRSAIRTRQAVALGVGLLLLVLLVLVFRGCAQARAENALRDYNREHTSIVSDSDQQVGVPFFDLLGRVGDDSPQDVAANIGSLRVTAEQHLRQAERLSVPDDMVPAHRSLLIALQLRRDGLDYIQQRMPSALADDEDTATEAVEEVAGQMQAFLASDVLHEGRVVPLIGAALDEAEIGGQQVQESRFMQSMAWLQPDFVAEQLDARGASAPDDGEDPAPGLHGHGLTGTTVGDTTLEPGEGAVNRIPSEEGLTFVVAFENQGEHDEFDVDVVVRVRPDEGSGSRGTRTVETVAQGATAEAPVTIENPPPPGTSATVEVEVAGVPGEENLDNNTAEYQVLFTDG